MPDYLAPGVYVEEISLGSAPIVGVSTSTTGMTGVTERGPVNFPILVTSIGEYNHWFGGNLNILDFSSGTDAFCYLPYAVQGFFTNGGQLLYITRIINQAAMPAATILFDRGTAATLSTVLYRAAAEGTGTIATPPALSLLDPTVLPATNAWFRLGNGSTADYVLVDSTNTPPADNPVVLNFPLSRAHANGAGVGAFGRAVDGTYGAAFQLSNSGGLSTQPNSSTLVVSGAAADITNLIKNAGQLLEIGTGSLPIEYRFAVKVVALPASATNPAGTSAFVTLDSGLAMTYPDGATVTPLKNVPAAASLTDTLGMAASPGDAVLFPSSALASAAGDLIIIEPSDTTGPEVRLVGGLSLLQLTMGAYVPYHSGLAVALVTPNDDDVKTTAPTLQNGTSIAVTDVTGLEQGMSVILDATGTPQTVVIQSVTQDAAPAITGTIIVTPPVTANPLASGVVVRPPGASLTAAAAAGASLIALDNRLGLSVGDVIRIGPANSAEFMTVAAIPGAGGAPPDPGNVVLSEPLAESWPVSTLIRRQAAPTVDTTTPGATVLPTAAGATMLVVTDGTGYNANGIIRVVAPDGRQFFHHLATKSTSPAPAPLYINQQYPLYNAHPVGEIAVPRNPLLAVQALDVGAWGNRLQVAVQDEPAGLVSGTTVLTVISPTQIKLASPTGVESGTILQFTDPTQGGAVVAPPVKVASINRTNWTIALDTPLSPAQISAYNNAKLSGQALGVQSREFSITIWWLQQPDPAIPSRNATAIDSEVFHNLSMDPRHSRYVQTIIGDINGPPRLSDGRPDGQSWYIRVHDYAQDLPPAGGNAQLYSVRLGPEPLTDVLPTGQVQPSRQTLEDGDDSIETLSDQDYIGQPADDPADYTGLFTLMNVDEISIIACPGRTGVDIQQALITQCETMRYRFAVLDGPPPPDDSINDVMAQRQQFDTKYAALYYPWLTIDDPYPKNLNNIAPFPIPPSGHVIGIYAQVDQEIGVFKAPANVVVNGITGLQRTLYKPQQDILNPYPVNIDVIRDFRMYDRGIVVYGARVITSDSEMVYINVRRLLIYIEASLYQGLQWAVFGDNAEPLWSQIRRSISNFLTVIWRNGGLQGATADQAFFVKCDMTTMTQTDIENGRLIAIVGVAPVYPAEYVIIRIGLWSPQSS